jgi:hypothetical protein
MVPMAVVTDAARTVIGPDDPAAAVRVIIVGRRIVEVPVKAMVPEREPAVAKAAVAENMTGAKPAAMKHSTTSSDAAASTTTAMETAAATMAATAVPAMSATDFGRQPPGSVFRCGRYPRIDQRQRLRALVSCGRQHQHRGSRKTQATDNTAPEICNLHHL